MNTPKVESLQHCIIQSYLGELRHKQTPQSAVLQRPAWEALRWWSVAGPPASPVSSPFCLWRSLFWASLLAASFSSEDLSVAKAEEWGELSCRRWAKVSRSRGLKSSVSFNWLAVRETAREGGKVQVFWAKSTYIMQLLKLFPASLGKAFP